MYRLAVHRAPDGRRRRFRPYLFGNRIALGIAQSGRARIVVLMRPARDDAQPFPVYRIQLLHEAACRARLWAEGDDPGLTHQQPNIRSCDVQRHGRHPILARVFHIEGWLGDYDVVHLGQTVEGCVHVDDAGLDLLLGLPAVHPDGLLEDLAGADAFHSGIE